MFRIVQFGVNFLCISCILLIFLIYREEAGNTFFNNQISNFAEDLWGVITEYLFLVKSIVFSYHFTEICFKASCNVSRSQRPSNIENNKFSMKATNCSLWRSDKFFPSMLNQRTRLLLLLAFLRK